MMSEEKRMKEKNEAIEHVIVIDDNFTSATVLNHEIKNLSLAKEVTAYTDGRTALEAILAKKEKGERLPNMIFLDLIMPEFTGWDFLDGLKDELGSNKPYIIIFTTSTQAKDAIKGAVHPMIDHYANKPLTGEELKHIFANCREQENNSFQA